MRDTNGLPPMSALSYGPRLDREARWNVNPLVKVDQGPPCQPLRQGQVFC